MPIVGGSSGGGYIPPNGRAWYDGFSVAVANGANGILTWDTLETTTDLLNRGTVAAPTVLAAGIYAVSVQVGVSAMTAGGSYDVEVVLDTAGDFAAVTGHSAAASAAVASPAVAVAATYYVPAGGGLRVQVTNFDGAASRNFTLNSAVVARLT